jgi:hypothetical protein
MNWLDTIIIILAGIGAAVSYAIFFWAYFKPREFEMCVLKPKGFYGTKRHHKKRGTKTKANREKTQGS